MNFNDQYNFLERNNYISQNVRKSYRSYYLEVKIRCHIHTHHTIDGGHTPYIKIRENIYIIIHTNQHPPNSYNVLTWFINLTLYCTVTYVRNIEDSQYVEQLYYVPYEVRKNKKKRSTKIVFFFSFQLLTWRLLVANVNQIHPDPHAPFNIYSLPYIYTYVHTVPHYTPIKLLIERKCVCYVPTL